MLLSPMGVYSVFTLPEDTGPTFTLVYTALEPECNHLCNKTLWRRKQNMGQKTNLNAGWDMPLYSTLYLYQHCSIEKIEILPVFPENCSCCAHAS
jgi:hypothetical protein